MERGIPIVICLNCGAKFQENVPECPYCGQIYIPGAEKVYMDNLHEIREDMSEIEEISEAIYRNEIRKNAKKTSVIIIVFLLLALLVIGGFAGISRLVSYAESEEEIKARMVWEREHFPILDAWYEDGEYQAILDFMEETYEEKSYSFYNWKHYQFIMQFEYYQICTDIRDRIAKGEEISEFDAGKLLYCGMSLMNYKNDDYGKEMYQKSELETLEQWKLEVEEIFIKELHYSKEELKEFQEKLYKDGFLSYDACCDRREDVLERIRMN